MPQSGAGDGTVGKALDVLDQVAGFGRPVRFGELQAGSPFPKATLYRFVQTLTRQGMLSFDAERQAYSPGVRLVRLAHAAWRQSSLAPLARPQLETLSRDAGKTVHLAQLDNGQVLYVDKCNLDRPVPMFSDAGKVGPAYCTGVGKAMLAWLPGDEQDRILKQQSFHQFTDRTHGSAASLRAELETIRARGHAFDNEEHEPGIICVALPILTDGGTLLGALSVTGHTRGTDLGQLGALAPRIQTTAARIAAEAQAWRFPETPHPIPEKA